jgi:hypothetical protein
VVCFLLLAGFCLLLPLSKAHQQALPYQGQRHQHLNRLRQNTRQISKK